MRRGYVVPSRWAGFKVVAVIALVLSMALAGCSMGSGDDLEDSDWVLATLQSGSALPDYPATLHLGEDGALSGSGGCNQFTGTWESGDNDAVTFEAAGMTLMACEEAVMAQEDAFLSALADTTAFDLDDDELTLRNASGEDIATMTRLDAADLVDTEWTVTAYNNGQEGVVSVLDEPVMTAAFGDDDRVTGNAGCNTYFADFSTDDDTISIGPVAATRMACDVAIMDQETAYLQALERAATFELGTSTLSLRADDGALLVTFRASE